MAEMILTIQVEIGNRNLRIINGFRPQKDEDSKQNLGFWQELESEIMNAKDNDCMIIIEMDANAKVGKEIIKDDPNDMTSNGKIMLDIIERQNLFIANAEDMCDGVITRERVVETKVEKSVIDYIIMCEKMKSFLMVVKIDDDRTHVLHRHIKSKSGTKIINSDHNILYSKFYITFNRKPSKIRTEFFNFKCEESKKKFFMETSTNTGLSTCFDEDFETGSNKFLKLLNRTYYKCF